MPDPKIVFCTEKKLVGMHRRMSLVNNTTHELWNSFMQRRHELVDIIETDKYSMQLYDLNYFTNFSPVAEFEKWAAVEVLSFDAIPQGMDRYILPAGKYAVFNYKGSSDDAGEMFRHIFNIWLPESNFFLDDRPHFEVLGEKYKNNDTESEEEIWIPIK
jgi:AraC family transcriptional regulator